MPSPAPQIPKDGQPITHREGRLSVPDRPIIPFIEGDGIGPDIWRASVRVFDAAVAKAYGGKRKIAWAEVYAGEKRTRCVGVLWMVVARREKSGMKTVGLGDFMVALMILIADVKVYDFVC